MKVIFIRQYDAFGDWISVNGLIRYLIKEHGYEKVYLVLEYNDTRKNFVNLLYGDDSRITTMMDSEFNRWHTFCGDANSGDIIDTRLHEVCPFIGTGNYWSHNNPFGTYKHDGPSSNSDNFYIRVGLDPKIKNEYFYFLRKTDLENELFEKLEIKKPYSVVCDYGENLIDRKYVKHTNIINLHNLSPNLVDVLKILENADDVHLIENTVSLLTYHLQASNLIDNFKVHLHAYSRKEPHRKCDGPNCNNEYLNMLLLPKLDNWEVIWS